MRSKSAALLACAGLTAGAILALAGSGGGGETGHVTTNLQRPRRQRAARRPLHARADQPCAALAVSAGVRPGPAGAQAHVSAPFVAAELVRRRASAVQRPRLRALRRGRRPAAPARRRRRAPGPRAGERELMTDLAERQAPPALAGAPAEPGALRALGQRAQTAHRGRGSPRSRVDRRARLARRVDALHRRSRDDIRARARPGCPLRLRSGSPSTPVFVLGFAALRGLYGTRLRYELLEELRAVLVAASLATVPVLLLRGLASDPGSTCGPRGSAPGPSQPPISPPAASRSTGRARRRTATASRSGRR